MIQKLIKLANKYDSENETAKADRLDRFIMKYADGDEEPTLEQILAEEGWLEEEGISPDALTDEDAMRGLEGEDAMVAENYLGGMKTEEIEAMIREISESQEQELREISDEQAKANEQKFLMDRLSEVLMQGKEVARDNPMRPPGEEYDWAQASLYKDLVKLSDMLDEQNMHKEADFFDKMLNKIAQEGPEDFFGDDDYEDEESAIFEDPSTEELSDLSSDDYLFLFMEFADKIANGMFMNMEAAQKEAEGLIKKYDDDHGTYDMPPEQENREFAEDEKELEDVLQFPGKDGFPGWNSVE
jgi:hypothetical protein